MAQYRDSRGRFCKAPQLVLVPVVDRFDDPYRRKQARRFLGRDIFSVTVGIGTFLFGAHYICSELLRVLG